MKRLLIAVLLLAAPAWAEEPVQLARMNPAVLGAGVSAATCTTPSTGSELNEGFLVVGYENTWAETVGSGGSINEDATLTGDYSGYQDDWCVSGTKTTGLSLTVNANETWTTWDRGSAIPRATYIVELVVYFNFISATLDAGTNAPLFTAFGAGGIFLKESGGNYYLFGNGDVVSDDVALSTGWHQAIWRTHPTKASSKFILDGSEYAMQRTTMDIQTIIIGPSTSIGPGEALSIEVGYVYLDIYTP